MLLAHTALEVLLQVTDNIYSLYIRARGTVTSALAFLRDIAFHTAQAWLNSTPHLDVFSSTWLEPRVNQKGRAYTHTNTHNTQTHTTLTHITLYGNSRGLKVDHYLLNRLPNKKRLIPLQARRKTLKAWRRSNIHHNWCVAKQITHISAHCSSNDSSDWTWQIP